MTFFAPRPGLLTSDRRGMPEYPLPAARPLFVKDMKKAAYYLHIPCRKHIFVVQKSEPHRLDWDTHQIILKTENASITNGGPHLRVA